MKTIALLASLLSTPALSASWVSVYNGNEKTMSSKDRDRIFTVLNSLGVDYREDSSDHILVPFDMRGTVREIVARALRESEGGVREALPRAAQLSEQAEADPLNGMVLEL